MGILESFGHKKEAASAVMREVEECDKLLAGIEEKRREIIYLVGQKFISENTEEGMQGSLYEAEFKELSRLAKEAEHTEKRKLAVQGLRKCVTCGNVLVIDSAFCNKCGSKLEKLSEEFVHVSLSETICPACGDKCESGALFCASCGKKLV